MATQLLEPFRHALFRRFFAGQAVSRVGDFVFFIAVPWQVIVLGGGPEEVGWVFTAFLASQLALSMVGGVVVDRLPRRSVVVASDVGQGALAALLAALAWNGQLSIELLAVVAAAFGGAQAVAMPAVGAFLPETVPPLLVARANALFQTALIAAGAGGFALAGFLLEIQGPASAFAVDAGSFAVSAAMLFTVRAPRAAPSPEEPRGGLLEDVRDGWAYVVRVPWLWIAIAIFAVFNAVEAAPRNVLLPGFVGQDLGGGAGGFALVNSLFMLGWLGGGLAIVLLPAVKRVGVVSYSSVLVTALMLVLLSTADSVLIVAVALTAQGIAFGVAGTLWQQAVMTLVHDRVRGRVISIDAMGSLSLMPVGTAVVGLAAEAAGVRAIFLAGGLVVAALGVAALATRRAREFREAPPPRRVSG